MVLDGLAFPRARQIEGGAVVRAQAGARKAQRDVDGGVEVHQLQGNQTLVVVGSQHGVIKSFRRLPVHAIGNGRAFKQGFRGIIPSAVPRPEK